MTPNQLLDKLATATPDSAYVFPPRLGVRVGEADALAARMLQWVLAQLPDDATHAQIEEVLVAALWWNTYLTSLVELDEPEAAGPARPEWMPTILKAED